MTKSPDIQFHKKGCKYRLISERDTPPRRLDAMKATADRGKFQYFRREVLNGSPPTRRAGEEVEKYQAALARRASPWRQDEG